MNLQAVNPEKRQFSRIAFDAPIILHNDGNEWRSKLLDISLKGVLVLRPDNWKQNENECFKLSIQLDNSDAEIDMDVKLTHTEDERPGFHCGHIDLDSATTLKGLVELNLGDEELPDREISHMLEQ
ncbi:MAG: PilZ domain-containing protein [Proteobacteria bacterium]|nr:PilZ domain-containing protein [Pseudomonadota bacterium]